MTENSTTGGEGTDSAGPISVLLVDDDEQLQGAVTMYAERHHDDIHITEASDGGTTLDRLAAEPFDCLVADPDALEVDGAQFVAEVYSIAPDLPVVWLTARDPGAIDDEVLAAGTTIVEKGDDWATWAFLFEKVRSAVQSSTAERGDKSIFELLVETARDGLYRLDANGTYTYANSSFAEMLGYDQDELLGKHASEVMVEGELERGQALIQELMEDEEHESDLMETQLVRKDGDHVDVEIHFAILTDEGTYDGLMGVVRDITERKERERELERQQARLEEFASVVSHDLRNPLNVARGRVSLAQADSDSEDLTMAEAALDRMETLIDDLLELARQGRMVETTEPVELQSVADESWSMVVTDGELELELDGATVQADRDRLCQLLENLFRNAVDHARSGVHVRVGLLADRQGFYVEDNGPGIPAEEREDVFDRGYSTADKGTGFGLSIVRNIVDAHGWDVTATEGDAGGARFEITEVEFQ